jgi:multiple antibiotic resistance protein
LAVAQDANAQPFPQAALSPLTLGKVFTFLFLTLGPFNVVGPFAVMTRGRDASFKRRLAFQGILIATLALFVAATLGAKTLAQWGVSTAAVFITAGILLFLVGLRFVRAQYQTFLPQAEAPRLDTIEPRVSALAFSPLAFPTIVTPYGIAVLVLAMTLPSDETLSDFHIFAVVALVLAADLLAMLAADRILNTPFVAAAFGIAGAVMARLNRHSAHP